MRIQFHAGLLAFQPQLLGSTGCFLKRLLIGSVQQRSHVMYGLLEFGQNRGVAVQKAHSVCAVHTQNAQCRKFTERIGIPSRQEIV